MAAENTAGLAILSMAILFGGYLVVVGLWYLMVFRPSREKRRRADDPQGTPTGKPTDRP